MLSAQVKADAKAYNKMYDVFRIDFYNGDPSKYYTGYGKAYAAASSYIHKGRYLSISGINRDGSKELGAC